MKRLLSTRAMLCAGLLFALVGFERELSAQNEADSTISVAREEQGVLVLHDGGVLIGRITLNGDRYLVKRSGNEMQVPAASVMLVSTSLEEAYNERRQRLTGPTADSHLALAEWCLRHNLRDQAARELSDVRILEPQHPRLELLERRLSMAGERPREKTAARPADPQPTVANAAQRVESSIGELPEGAIELFTRKVQPVLVNNCTTSGCHQRGGAQPFQLDRAILHGQANRRSTMHNLAAALELVDRQQPQLSQLLTVPRQKHGGMEKAIFGPRQQPAFSHLVDWVALVTNAVSAEDEEPVATAESDPVTAAQRSVEQLTSPVLRVPRPAGEPSVASDVAQAGFSEPVTPSEAQRLRYGAQLKHWRPRDPFDPEIFNRQRRQPQTPADPPETDGSNN